MSNVNKNYNRLYYVPQLGMFHREISVLITIDVYKWICTLPVKVWTNKKTTTILKSYARFLIAAQFASSQPTHVFLLLNKKIYFDLEIYMNHKMYYLDLSQKHFLTIKLFSKCLNFNLFWPTFDW